jgi:hypothetical protein
MFGLPSLNSLKQQAIDRGKQEAQGVVTKVASSDAAKSALDTTGKLATSVGLGDQFEQLKETVASNFESVTGLSLSGPTGCPPDRIDIPTVSNVLVSTADTPYEPVNSKDAYLSYVIVDPRNPPPNETANKTKLWYISIANAVFLIGLGILYGQINK